MFDNAGGHDTLLRIPFSSVAFDTLTHELFAGAGHARATDGGTEYNDFYPTTNGQAAGNEGQWSLWRCDLDVSQDFSHVEDSAHGKMRQIAVAHFEDGSTTVSRVAYACDDGVILNEAGAVQNIWVGTDKRGIAGPISEDPWGVAAGRDGIVYALTSRSDPEHAPPGLWSFDLTTDPDTTSWHAVKGDNSVWPHTTPWDVFLSEPTRDLTELTVIPGSGSTPDEIFVGEGGDGAEIEGGSDSFGLAGYFRYGLFTDDLGPRTGWAHIHRTQSNTYGQMNRIVVADWRSGAITADTLSYDVTGWHSYSPSLRALVPFAVHPTNTDLMVAVDYGIPLITTDGGAQWSNLYCEGDGSAGWSGRGLHLLCATSGTFTSDGRIVLGARDYGAFIGVDASNTAYRPLHDLDHVTPPYWPTASDVETVDYGGVHEIYMADSAPWYQRWPVSTTHEEDWIWLWNEQSREWMNVTGLKEVPESLHATVATALNGSFPGCFSVADLKIDDIEFVDPSMMFVAASAKVLHSVRENDYNRHHVICKGTRVPATTQWQWSVLFDLDPGNHGTAVINRLCVIPGRHVLLLACMSKGYTGGWNQGGLYSLDYTNPGAGVRRWLGGDYASSDPIKQLGNNVTAIATDRLAQYVYAGCSGHDTPWSNGRGGVVRFRLDGSSPADTTVLAGLNDTFELGDTGNFQGTQGRAGNWCTRISDFAIDPHNPLVIYAAVGNGRYFDEHFGAWRFQAGNWVQVTGNGETGSGAASVGINPLDSSQLYVGTRSQEFFKATIPVSAHPVVADTARFPVAAVTADSTVLAVFIASGDTVQTATATLDGLGLSGTEVALVDNGKVDDLAAGDGIFTSQRFLATLAPGNYQVRVFAQDDGGGYDQRDVAVEVIACTAKFTDVTSSTGDLASVLTEQPYSAVYFQSIPGDTLSANIMIVTFDSDGSSGTAQTPQILQMTYVAEDGAPQFTLTTDEWIGLQGFAAGGRGISYADYDNDGDNDFFMCNPLHGGKLYRNDLDALPAGFTDVTAAVFGSDAAYVSEAIAASWGDYNADGFVDLYVATTNYYGSLQALELAQFSGGGGGGGNITCSGHVFRNVGGASLHRYSLEFGDQNNVLLSACWTDLDNDGDLDEISAKFILGVISVLENHGFDYAWGDYLLVPGEWSYPTAEPDYLFGANSVTVIDYDHDVYPDLLVTFATYDESPKVKVLRNNYPTSKVFTAIEVSSGTAWNGATVADFDFNGQEDVLLHPRGSSSHPALLMASGYDAGGPTYQDLGYSLGLRNGATGGGLAVNFDEAKGIDLFLGRGDGTGTKAVYHNDGGPSATSAWLEVRLHPNGNSNRSLIGTKVLVEADGRQWRRTVDGGSGRGGQSSNQLLFGLGDMTGNATVSWRFPSGETGSAPSVGVNSIVDVVESQVPVLKPSTHADLEPDYQFAFGPGTADWIFHWCTTNNKGDIDQDEVDIQNVRSYTEFDYCSIGIEPGAIRTLGFGDADASFLVYWDGTYWHHEVRWSALPCVNSCQYRFRVRSGAGGQSVSSNWRTINTGTFCVVDPGVPQQP